MKRKTKKFWGVLAIIALPIIGYTSTYGLTFFPSLEGQSALYHGIFSLLLIAVLLAVPYFMIKLLSYVAHVQNPEERELHLSDLPKDKDQLNRHAKT